MTILARPRHGSHLTTDVVSVPEASTSVFALQAFAYMKKPGCWKAGKVEQPGLGTKRADPSDAALPRGEHGSRSVCVTPCLVIRALPCCRLTGVFSSGQRLERA